MHVKALAGADDVIIEHGEPPKCVGLEIKIAGRGERLP